MRLFYFCKQILKAVLDLISPKFCYHCKKSLAQVGNRYLCGSCWKNMPLIRETVCFGCGLPLAMEMQQCLDCKAKDFSFTQARCAGRYEGILRELILKFKFSGFSELHFLFAALIHWQIKRHPFPEPIHLIVPVPMWPQDQYVRGYNQAELISHTLASQLHVLHYPKALSKIKISARQAELGQHERRKNVENAFAITNSEYKQALFQKNVLLIDDIFTTGSTLHECARALKKGSVQHVYVATIARTILG